MKGDYLDRRADISTVRLLHSQGLLNNAASDAASKMAEPHNEWWGWTSRILLFMGCFLILAGIFLLFARNLIGTEYFVKIALLILGVAACTLVAFLLGRTTLGGQALLLSGALLIGLPFILYAQEYGDTGMTHSLYFWWLIIAFGFAVAAELAMLWIIWLVVLNTWVATLYLQTATLGRVEHPEITMFLLAIVNTLAIWMRWICLNRQIPGLQYRWVLNVLTAMALLPLTSLAVYYLYAGGQNAAFVIIGIGTWVAGVAAGYWYFRYRVHDIISVAFVILSMYAFILNFAGKFVYKLAGREEGSSCIMAFVVLIATAGMVVWLKYLSSAMKGGRDV